MLFETEPENEKITEAKLAILIALNCFDMARPESQDLPDKALKKKQTITNINEYKFKDGWITRKEIQDILSEIFGKRFYHFESRIAKSINPLIDKGFVEEGKITWSRGIGGKQINGVIVNRIKPTLKNLKRVDKILSDVYWKHFREIHEIDRKIIENISNPGILSNARRLLGDKIALNIRFISMSDIEKQWIEEHRKKYIEQLAERTANNRKEATGIKLEIDTLINLYDGKAKKDYDNLVKAKLKPFKDTYAQLSIKIKKLRRPS